MFCWPGWFRVTLERINMLHKQAGRLLFGSAVAMLVYSAASVATEAQNERIRNANEAWFSGEQPELTGNNQLLDALIQARRHNAEYAAAKSALAAGREAWPQARAAALPSLRGEINFTQIDRDVEATPFSNIPNSGGGTGGTAGGPPSAPFSDSFLDEQYRIELRQPLFNFSIPALLRQGHSQVSKAELDFAVTRKVLISSVAGAYLDFLVAGEQLELAKAEKKAVASDRKLAKARYDVGETGVTGLREAQAAFDLIEAQLVDARSELGDARDRLFELTQVQYPRLPGLVEKIDYVMPEPVSPSGWLDIALRYNGEYLKARHDVQLASDSINAKRGNQLPKLDLVAYYTKLDNTDFVFGSASQDKAIGLQASWDIFAGGLTLSQVRQARAEYEASQARLVQNQRQLRTEVFKSYRDIEQAIRRVRAQRQVIKSAQAALEANAAGFEFGERTQADLQNARRTLFQARVEYTTARYDYLRGVLRLKLVAGVLTQDDLRQAGRLLSGDLVPAVKQVKLQE